MYFNLNIDYKMIKNTELIIFIPSIEGGGVEKNLFIISNFLSSKFKKVKFITSSSGFKKLNKNIEIVNIKFLGSLISSRFLKIILSSILLSFQLIKNKNVIVLSFQANIFAILISSIFNTKIVARLNSSPTGWVKNEFKKKLFKKIYSLANLIIVNSNDFRRELLVKFRIKSYCIFNPLDKKNIIKKSKIKLNKSPYKFNNSLKIINIGRLVDQKDHLTLLKSINLLKKKLKIELLIIGQGEKKIELEKYIEKNSLEKIVKILDFKKNPYPFIRSSDLFILSSKYEGLPNVILEAVVLKKFVISSDCPTGPKEILDNGKGGTLFKTGSYKDLSKKILEYTKNKKFKEKTNFAYKSLSKYDYKKNLNKYFNKLIEVN